MSNLQPKTFQPSTRSWPDSEDFWRDKRVIVTGGAGFLGSFVVEKLQQRGAADIIIPRSSDYDLTQIDAIRQLLLDTSLPQTNKQTNQLTNQQTNTKPVDIIIHLAARVGGIGANRAHPAEYFYDNPSTSSGQA